MKGLSIALVYSKIYDYLVGIFVFDVVKSSLGDDFYDRFVFARIHLDFFSIVIILVVFDSIIDFIKRN